MAEKSDIKSLDPTAIATATATCATKGVTSVVITDSELDRELGNFDLVHSFDSSANSNDPFHTWTCQVGGCNQPVAHYVLHSLFKQRILAVCVYHSQTSPAWTNCLNVTITILNAPIPHAGKHKCEAMNGCFTVNDDFVPCEHEAQYVMVIVQGKLRFLCPKHTISAGELDPNAYEKRTRVAWFYNRFEDKRATDSFHLYEITGVLERYLMRYSLDSCQSAQERQKFFEAISHVMTKKYRFITFFEWMHLSTHWLTQSSSTKANAKVTTTATATTTAATATTATTAATTTVGTNQAAASTPASTPASTLTTSTTPKKATPEIQAVPTRPKIVIDICDRLTDEFINNVDSLFKRLSLTESLVIYVTQDARLSAGRPVELNQVNLTDHLVEYKYTEKKWTDLGPADPLEKISFYDLERKTIRDGYLDIRRPIENDQVPILVLNTILHATDCLFVQHMIKRWCIVKPNIFSFNM